MFHLDRRLKKAELRRGYANTPGTYANTPGRSKPTEHKRQAEKSKGDQLEMERARKTKKNRIVEYSEDESDEDEESEWAVVGREGEAEKTAVSRANEPSGTDKEQTPKTVGNKRKLSEEATRRSTRKRRGVNKMVGVMIHRIEHKEKKYLGRGWASMTEKLS